MNLDANSIKIPARFATLSNIVSISDLQVLSKEHSISDVRTRLGWRATHIMLFFPDNSTASCFSCKEIDVKTD